MSEQSWREEADIMWAFFRENRALMESNRIQLELLREQSQETERLMREQSQETDRRINQLYGTFSNQWGPLQAF